MNIFTLLSLLDILVIGLGIFILLTMTPIRNLFRDHRIIILILLLLSITVSISNILEWSYNTAAYDIIEDIQVLEVIVFGILFYILYQSRLTEQIRKNEAQYRLILENQSDFVVKVDTEGRFLFVSPSYCKTFGKSSEELMGHQFQPLVHEDDIEETLKEMRKLYQPPYSCMCTQRAKTIYGWRWLTWADKAILDENNEVCAIVGVGRDVTEQIESELERERLLKKLDTKNRELQSIVSVASHDLKSPLVNILGFNGELSTCCKSLVDLIQNNIPETINQQVHLLIKDMTEAQSFIQSGGKKMQVLIDGLLTISRIGTQEMQIENIDMNHLLEDVRRSMNYQIQNNGITLHIEDLPPCASDSRQLNQVFSNLLDNAIKYMDPARPGIIRITGQKKNGTCEYRVIDNGIGISREHYRKIFEIYHRLNPDNENSGHGLGLTIVATILERLGGSVRVESEPGSGSSFIIRLPAMIKNQKEDTTQKSGLFF